MLQMPGLAMMFPPLAVLAAVAATSSGPTQQKCSTTGSLFVQRAGMHGRSQSFEPVRGQQQPVRAAVAEDGQSAAVSILLEDGQTWQTYDMHPEHVVSADADLLAIVDGQNVRLAPVSNLFSSSKPGQVAKASIQSDGQVLGIFQHGKQMLRVMPMESIDQDAPPMQLETDTRLHHVRVLHFSEQEEEDEGGDREEQEEAEMEKVKEEQEDHGANTKPKLAVDDNHGDNSVLQPVAGDALPSMESGVEAAWGGVKWFPGCFPGDSNLHIMKIGVAADVEAFNDIKSRAKLQQILEQIVHESNIIYENQLNIRLQVGAIRLYETSNGAPAWARGCSKMGDKLDQFTKSGVPQLPSMADWQLLTGCGTGYGTVGLAWMGTLCHQGGYNSGVNQLITYSGTSVPTVVDQTWRIFAHELGHNFAADHSFEDGQQRTGGIMDYGDGKLKGVYQFNTKYRKGEVCQHVKQTKQSGKCGSNFKEGGGGGGKPRPVPTPRPRPTPSPAGDCRDTDGRCATKWKGKCNKKNVQKKCRQSCDLCGGGGGGGGGGGECKDTSSKCQTKWKHKCSKNNIKKKCPLTCGVCSKSGSK